jgi:pilus assembly protein CpaE
MLSAAVASSDASYAHFLRACLQQSGLVHNVVEWPVTKDNSLPVSTPEAVPDVVLLGLHRQPEPYFALASQVRRLRPTVRIIACSRQTDKDPQILLQAMRSGVQEFLAEPVNPQVLSEILQRFVQENQQVLGAPVEKLVAVMGSKGGVGTSTVAVNLGVQMATLGRKRVALLDFGRPLGHSALLLDLRPKFSLRDAVSNLERLDGHFLGGLLTTHSSGLEVLTGTTDPEEWTQVSPLALQRLVNVAQSCFDTVLMDAGSFYSPDLAPILRTARQILLVTEASVPALWALERSMTALGGICRERDKVRVVINRWSRDDDEVLKSVEKNIKRPIFARLPNDFRQVSEATNLGTPLYRNHNNRLVQQYQQLASRLAGIPAPAAAHKGVLGNLFFPGKAR